MKKLSTTVTDSEKFYLKKTILIMKLATFLLLVNFIHLSANVSAQSERFTIKNERMQIKELIDKIEFESNYKFLYRSDYINDKFSSVDAENLLLEDLLTVALKETGLTYHMLDNQLVVITPESTLTKQQIKVTGTVTDATTGEPLPGVNVVIEGTNTGVITDALGKYSLGLPSSDMVIIFSFIGYNTEKKAVEGKSIIDVALVTDIKSLEEVVVVGYGTQRKGNVTGSVASVKGDDLVKTPVASTTNALVGRLPGLISLQSVGQPGYDAALLSIRGFGNALVVVDGIEADLNSLDANEIESISILKDGAASIYGSRAGNGVILVTTKRGNNQKPTIIYKSSFTMQGITDMPKTSSAGQYTEMEREAWIQSGKPETTAPYTLEEIQKYYEGTDPQYPNTNWYNELIRNWAPEQQHNISVRGGSEKIKYYGSLGYLDQKTIWKKAGGGYTRYNLQSNLDANILDNLSLRVDIASTIEARKFPWRPMGEGNNTSWQDFWYTLPIYPATLPDPTKISFAGGGGTGGAHVVTNRNIAGYYDLNDQNIKGTMALKYNFKVIEGLSAEAFVNYSQDYGSNKNFQKPVNFYTYDYASDIYTLAGSLGNNGLFITKNQNRMITGQYSLNYDNTFGKDHHFSVLALYEVIDYYNDVVSASRKNFLTYSIDQMFAGSTTGMLNSGSASEMGRKSVIGRLNYSFRNKYLFESTFRLDASAKFPAEKRWGFFPSISLGWRLSEENFLKQTRVFDDLKLRANYGSSGNDGVGNFQYLAGYGLGDQTYLIGSNIIQGIISSGLANPNLTWEKIKIYNIGLDFSVWKRKIYGEIDAFYRERTGIPATRISTLPSTFGSMLPPENINSLNNRGFELGLGTAGNIQDFNWDINGNISWSRAVWGHYEEPLYDDLDQARIYTYSGRWTDQQFGYLSNGLFTSQEEINTLGYDQDNNGNTTLRPGDIKYKDVNSDGVINWKDQVLIGKGTTPHWMLGLNSNLQYKNFDLSILFQGAMGYYNYIVVPGGSVSSVYYKLRWTEENNNPNAFIPRLGGASSNSWTSDHYYKKAGYVRLKTFTIGYNFPVRWLTRYNIKQVRIYASGMNLLTFSKLKQYNIDPESPSGAAASGLYYPQQKTISFGINISL